MTITPETVARHELIGLQAAVVEATSPDYVGIAGEVVAETTQTVRLDAGDRVLTVPKNVATFEFELPGGQYATVEGDQLIARPARRTETGGTQWHSD